MFDERDYLVMKNIFNTISLRNILISHRANIIERTQRLIEHFSRNDTDGAM